MRNIYLTRALLALATVAPGVLALDASDVTVKPLSMTTQIDFGQVVKGHRNYQTNIDKSNVQRTSVWITQEITVGSRLDVRAGIGGIFWYELSGPPGFGEANRFSSTANFGPGITRADMEYRFNDAFTLQAGYFPYKYNRDAKNLGEYLLRSGTYPGYVTGGGWNLISEAVFMMQGVRLKMALWDGKFQSEFLLPIERDMPPNGDVSPTYVATLKPVAGVELGAGATCNHCISVKPSKTSPEVRYTAGNAISGNGSGYIIKNPNFDTSSARTTLAGANPYYIYDTTGFYTFKGVKLMARASFDPKAYVPMPRLGSEDLKVFGEVALLGVKNYPFYYEDRTRRMPVMFGVNLPTFRILDVLSFQMEYYNSAFPNSIENAYRYLMPTTPFVDSTGTTIYDPNFHDPDNELVTRDNWKWSIYAKKEVVQGIRLYAQIANDNLRLPEPLSGAVNTWLPVTNIQKRDWYYLLRFEMGI